MNKGESNKRMSNILVKQVHLDINYVSIIRTFEYISNTYVVLKLLSQNEIII